jgi:hypothetical protein
MDDLTIHIDDLVLDAAAPLDPDAVAALAETVSAHAAIAPSRLAQAINEALQSEFPRGQRVGHVHGAEAPRTLSGTVASPFIQ